MRNYNVNSRTLSEAWKEHALSNNYSPHMHQDHKNIVIHPNGIIHTNGSYQYLQTASRAPAWMPNSYTNYGHEQVAYADNSENSIWSRGSNNMIQMPSVRSNFDNMLVQMGHCPPLNVERELHDQRMNHQYFLNYRNSLNQPINDHGYPDLPLNSATNTSTLNGPWSQHSQNSPHNSTE